MSLPLSVTHVRNSEIKQLLTLFSAMLWDIDLIFGMCVHSDKLQIEFTFRSGPMIFGRVMALGLWNLAKYLVVTTFFRYAWRYWLFIMFTFRSSPMIFGPWTLKFGEIFSCHPFFSLCLEIFSLRINILTWYLVCECIMISYRSCLHFVPSNDLWPSYGPWTLKFGQIFSCHHFLSLFLEILTWFLVI